MERSDAQRDGGAAVSPFRSAKYVEPPSYRLVRFRLFSDPFIAIPLLAVAVSIVIGLVLP